MALSDRQWQTIERRSGVPKRVMQVLLGYGERSGQSSVSPMGARGRAQLMPATARSLERKYHINTSGEFGNVLGGAFYLAEQKRTFGNWRLAFAAYNAGPGAVKQYNGVPPFRETQDYVKRTMDALTKGGGATTGMASPGSPGTPGTPGTPDQNITFRSRGGVPDYSKIIEQNLSDIVNDKFDPLKYFQRVVAENERASRVVNKKTVTIPGLPGIPGTAGTTGTYGGKGGKVILLKGADRAGVHTQGDILGFARRVSSVFGAPLRVGTGTNHSQMTVNGRQSQHWTGEAVDIPASGATLTRMGRAALIAAGMPRAQAMKQKGGLFNIGGHQVIFNTTEGGNHWNHLHLGF